MNTLDIVLIDVICYMGGLFTGLGICFKYKHDLLVRTSSHAQLQDLVQKITNDIQAQTSEGPPVMATAPSVMATAPSVMATAPSISEVISPMKEIIVRTT
jgi:hypothetical protein